MQYFDSPEEFEAAMRAAEGGEQMANGIEAGKGLCPDRALAEGIQGSISHIMGGEASSAGESAGTLLGTKLVGTLKKVIAVRASAR